MLFCIQFDQLKIRKKCDLEVLETCVEDQQGNTEHGQKSKPGQGLPAPRAVPVQWWRLNQQFSPKTYCI